MFASLIVAVAMLSESATPSAKLSPNATEILAAQAAAGSGALASPKQLAEATEKAARDVSKSLRSLQTLSRERADLRRAYDRELAALDKLSRQRASWNRDRQISKKKSSSSTLARKLKNVEGKARRAAGVLTARRRSLLGAVRSELSGSVGGKRKATLQRLEVALNRHLRPKVRKILLPDASIDRLADPEELEEQAALIARAEKRLREEDGKLEERYRYYSKQQKLRQQSERAAEVARRDNDSVRRSPGLGNGGSGEISAESDSASDPGPQGSPENGDSESEEGGGGSTRDFTLESSSVILADVVDEVTAEDLKRAGRRANPAARANAAKRARKQLKDKLERLRKQRKLIQERARKLRSR